MKTFIRIALTALFAFCLLSGCRLDDFTSVFSQAEKHAGNISKASKEFTPEQEHYLGRAVAARIIQQYGASGDKKANGYLNQVGQALALHSSQPLTYGGYHFMLLDSAEVNAFAAPDGFIFVTRGMVGLLSGESELAAVLAHEIAHVQNKDAVKAIKSSRMTEALLVLGKDAASKYASELPGSKLLDLFSGSVDDIVGTLVSSGYSRSQEYAADAKAREILAQAGYNPDALAAVLRVMEKRVPKGDSGLGATHPSASSRLSALKGTGAAGPEAEARARRFQAALGGYGGTTR